MIESIVLSYLQEYFYFKSVQSFKIKDFIEKETDIIIVSLN